MERQTAGRDNLGNLAPKFAELNDDVLFGEIWSREDKLSLRDRSMITISALMIIPTSKITFGIRKKTRTYKRRSRRDSNTACFLYRMGKRMECISNG